ncbi:MAG: hypothetical protein Q8L76_06935 [Cypionkella sp.]|nr:hypothetical protein [Cypionkella sp.]
MRVGKLGGGKAHGGRGCWLVKFGPNGEGGVCGERAAAGGHFGPGQLHQRRATFGGQIERECIAGVQALQQARFEDAGSDAKSLRGGSAEPGLRQHRAFAIGHLRRGALLHGGGGGGQNL